MSASTTGFSAPGAWSWPDDLPRYSPPEASSEQSSRPGPSTPQAKSGHSERPQERRRHWRPRTCRICLETVHPTFHDPSENLPGMFQGAPYATYQSEEGRLLRPCRCKGSQAYVHEGCLQAWRHSDPGYGTRNFWQCPTCSYRYKLERMQWGRWVSSKAAQIGLTIAIFWLTIFLLGFVADPIINAYVDPVSTITSIPGAGSRGSKNARYHDEEESSTWGEHFLKGFASLGVLGFIKMFFTLGPFQWFHMRGSIFGGGGGGRAGTTGRDRVASISWLVLVVGICAFLYTVWKAVRALSRRFLEKAGERVMDVPREDGVQEDEDDD